MPIDFETYVLSSSPPGFELNYVLNDHYIGRGDDSSRSRRSRFGNFGKQATWPQISVSLLDETGTLDDDETPPSQPEKTPRAEITCPKTLQRISSWNEHYNGCSVDANECCICKPEQNGCLAPPPPSSGGKVKRKISFADEIGKQLEAVRIMEESSEVPPSLLTDAVLKISSQLEAVCIDTPRLAVNFPQPASDYVNFRHTVETKFVSLENVIVKGYSVVGTVRVKHISFEKTVFVRYTLDKWVTFSDVRATYVYNGLSDDCFNTFSFTIDLPRNLKAGCKLNFAVKYVACGGQEFWDSNGGENYEIIYPANDQSASKQSPAKVGFVVGDDGGVWSEFSGWNDVDSDLPYW